jgi:DNA-binding SARP family transcriptional activator
VIQGNAVPQSDGIRFSVLGPLSAHVGGRTVALGPLKQRTLLAVLLVRPNTVASVDLLMDALWDEEPPRTARKNVQVYVSALRRLLDEVGAGGRLLHRADGYQLLLDEDELDSLRFAALARSGREAAAHGAFAPAARLLRDALRLWSGPPLPEFPCSGVVAEEAGRLANRRLQVYEDWAEIELRLGNAADVAEDIGELVERNPQRERLLAAQMNCLSRLGRQTEAFAVYEGHRQLLASEFGLTPSPAIEALYQSMLTSSQYLDTAAVAGSPGSPGAAGVTGAVGSGRRPGPAPSGPVRTLLPRDLPDFTGRAEQLAELLTVLDGGKRCLAVVSGPVGVGKTALAVHAAHRLARHYPDGMLLVRGRDEARGEPRRWAAVLGDVARFAGLRAPGAPSPDDPREREEIAADWRSWLAHRQILLLLDDVTDESGVRSLVPDDGASALVVTSRSQLAALDSAHRVQVAPLPDAEARTLLGRIIGARRAESDPVAVRRIVAATGTLPLGVRAAGLKLAALRHLPLAEYASRLERSDGLLAELTVGDLDVRGRLASGWHELSAGEQAAVGRLCQLETATFSLGEAARVLRSGLDAACHDLEALIDAGAVIPPGDEVNAQSARYALPRLVRAYVHDREQRGDAAERGDEADGPGRETGPGRSAEPRPPARSSRLRLLRHTEPGLLAWPLGAAD